MGSFSDQNSETWGASDSAFIERHRRCFDELGACLCSHEFDIGCESLASIVDFVLTQGRDLNDIQAFGSYRYSSQGQVIQ